MQLLKSSTQAHGGPPKRSKGTIDTLLFQLGESAVDEVVHLVFLAIQELCVVAMENGDALARASCSVGEAHVRPLTKFGDNCGRGRTEGRHLGGAEPSQFPSRSASYVAVHGRTRAVRGARLQPAVNGCERPRTSP